MTYKVLISDPLSEDGIYPLREAENIEIIIETELTHEQLLEKVKDVDALLVRSQTQVTKEVIENGKRLKIIGRAGVGVDNIDLEAATENGVIVVNAPDGNTNSAAEHTMAMIMALARKIPQAYYTIKNRKWDRKSHIGVELRGKTLGIVGLGRIGSEVAYRAKGQRMNVIAYDPFLTEEKAENMGIGYATLEEVFQKADFITVHTPLMKETRHIINADAFRQMKDGVRIVNCARGGIIDEDALYDAIVSGKVAGAAVRPARIRSRASATARSASSWSAEKGSITRPPGGRRRRRGQGTGPPLLGLRARRRAAPVCGWCPPRRRWRAGRWRRRCPRGRRGRRPRSSRAAPRCRRGRWSACRRRPP